MTKTQNPAPTATNPVEDRRVQPDGPLSGEVQRGGVTSNPTPVSAGAEPKRRRGRKPAPLADRMAASVVIDPETGCHNWRGTKGRTGYGRMKLPGRRATAHRVAYELAKGPIPPNLEVDHLCFNRSCCNPDHLEAVTHLENVRRAAARITHCPRGHAYTPENTSLSNGHRSCRACGVAAAALRRRPRAPRTHCNRGHELSGDNVWLYRGHRVCRACMKMHGRARTERLARERAMTRPG